MRTATTKDIDGLLGLLTAAFNLEPGSEKFNKKKAAVDGDLQQWRILEDNSQIIGAVHIRKDWLRIGKTKILKGDVGDVSVCPTMQGKGIGSLILNDTLKWMKGNHYDLSRLGGLCRYYSRFGYQRFIRRYFEFNVGTLARAGASNVLEGVIPLTDTELACIRSFDPVKDHSGGSKLAESFGKLYNGSSFTVAEQPPPPGGKIDPLNLVYEEDNTIVGHIEVAESETEVSDFEARIRIYLHGYEKTKPYVIKALIAHINNYAFARGIKRMTARIPFDAAIIQALAATPLRFKTVETYGGISGNMLQIVNLESLLSRISPELEQRLAESTTVSWHGIVNLKTAKDSALLKLDAGKISVVNSGTVAATITIPEVQLMRMILGITAFSELDLSQHEAIPVELKIILNGLFTCQLTSSDNWG
jgi:predicted N-acetyltransferase YhbS